ncbi:glycosyltransferase [uncultured Deefgea sp.]|uniref:glycosyltransferase n=1 Tax=uncultured Deefgea sp. TaxID=1304914 RepID=UPI00261B7243|nr:glycosyltransferase [uncultured Deefgea sp.]
MFVFPSKTDTFGLVLLEAMACGCPVAAYPVTGPIDVIGSDGPGALNENLHEACLAALRIDRNEVRRFAERYSWAAASRQFLSHLHPFTPTAQEELRLIEQGAIGE